MSLEFAKLVCDHLNQLSNDELVNRNRYNRVLISKNETEILKSLASVYDHKSIPDNISTVFFSVLVCTNSSIFDEIAHTINLSDEWESIKSTKKLHESELQLFEKLLNHHNKRIYLMITDFQEVYKDHFSFDKANRILEELATIINSFQGLFFCVICGQPILNDLLFATLPKHKIQDYPNYTQHDMNNTKLRIFLLDS